MEACCMEDLWSWKSVPVFQVPMMWSAVTGQGVALLKNIFLRRLKMVWRFTASSHRASQSRDDGCDAASWQGNTVTPRDTSQRHRGTFARPMGDAGPLDWPLTDYCRVNPNKQNCHCGNYRCLHQTPRAARSPLVRLTRKILYFASHLNGINEYWSTFTEYYAILYQ